MEWVIAHGGEPESTVTAGPSRGVHSSGRDDSREAGDQTPLCFVLLAGALT
jgi:hypothetical protein